MTDRSNGYERIAADFLAGRGGPATAGIGATAVRTWARTLPAGATVLDLGCGSGLPITQVLINEGLNVYAVDASKTLVAAFRARFPNAPVACEPVEDSAFFHRSFDAVVAWGLWFLLPAETQRDLLGRIAAILVPEGRFLFTSPPQAIAWNDAMTGEPSRSLGADAYRECLSDVGLFVTREFEDEGENHYYDAVKQGRHHEIVRDGAV